MTEYIEREAKLRKDCPMRHENGNCLPNGGFCTAVIDPICEAMHNAYRAGKATSNVAAIKHGNFVNGQGNPIISFNYLGRASDAWGNSLYCPVYCSECGVCLAGMNGKINFRNYCPNCGADLRGDNNE